MRENVISQISAEPWIDRGECLGFKAQFRARQNLEYFGRDELIEHVLQTRNKPKSSRRKRKRRSSSSGDNENLDPSFTPNEETPSLLEDSTEALGDVVSSREKLDTYEVTSSTFDTEGEMPQVYATEDEMSDMSIDEALDALSDDDFPAGVLDKIFAEVSDKMDTAAKPQEFNEKDD